MSEDIWKTYKSETYCYFSVCPFEIRPKLSDENKMPVEGKECDYQGFHYVVRKVPGRDGKQAWYKVVRTGPVAPGLGQPTGTSPSQFDQRQADIAQAHAENMAASKALTAAINAHSAVLAVTNDLMEKYLKSNALNEDKIAELLKAARTAK
jgi:hypothetical protein